MFSWDPELLLAEVHDLSELGRDMTHWHGGKKRMERARKKKQCQWQRQVCKPRGKSSCNKPHRMGHGIGRGLQHWHWGLTQEAAWRAFS